MFGQALNKFYPRAVIRAPLDLTGLKSSRIAQAVIEETGLIRSMGGYVGISTSNYSDALDQLSKQSLPIFDAAERHRILHKISKEQRPDPDYSRLILQVGLLIKELPFFHLSLSDERSNPAVFAMQAICKVALKYLILPDAVPAWRRVARSQGGSPNSNNDSYWCLGSESVFSLGQSQSLPGQSKFHTTLGELRRCGIVLRHERESTVNTVRLLHDNSSRTVKCRSEDGQLPVYIDESPEKEVEGTFYLALDGRTIKVDNTHLDFIRRSHLVLRSTDSKCEVALDPSFETVVFNYPNSPGSGFLRLSSYTAEKLQRNLRPVLTMTESGEYQVNFWWLK